MKIFASFAVCLPSVLWITLLAKADDNAIAEQPMGGPVALQVEPQAITLTGPRSGQQLLVTGRYADGSVRDLTSLAEIAEAGGVDRLDIQPFGFLIPRADGQTHVDIRVGERSARIPVTIRQSQERQSISFRRELMPVLSAAGCSDIRCHGAPSGKNEFRLSLWGHNPDLDFRQLTRDAWGRRTNRFAADQSLIMLKATAGIPHVGGQRFKHDSRFAEICRAWQSEGLHDDPDSAKLRSLTVLPKSRVLPAPARSQQLAVKATFEDGRVVDVTRLTTYASTDLAVADVGRTGFVEFKQSGEAAIVCRYLSKMETVRLMHIESPPKEYRWPDPPKHNFVDTHTFAKLKQLHIAPSDLCSDAIFIRRVFLDLCGVLPTPDETRAFRDDTNLDKRARLIDQLLQRPEFADYWTKKWLDVLRVSRDSINLEGAQAYHGWLREHINNDVSFAQVVTELLTSQGESYRDPATNFYCAAPMPRDVEDPNYLQKDLAEATAQLFLGIRLQCAQCHNHPYERWTQDDYLSLAAFFTQVKRSRLGKEGSKGRPERRQISVALDLEAKGVDAIPHFPGEAPLQLDSKQDRRQVLAAWLTGGENPFFAKAVVNRVWFHLFGQGIVDPVDDFRDSNPSVNDALLEGLAAEFIAKGFRLKSIIRTIVNSRTYQLSAQPNEFNRDDSRYFSHRQARPLPAEVLLDAICEVTAVPEAFEITKDYTIGIPEGVVKLPAGTRAVQLPVTDIVTLINTSGKYVRYEMHPFLRKFGQPKRAQTCECDREQSFGRKQVLELIVGPLLDGKLTQENNRIGQALMEQKADAELLEEIYLRALCRTPSKHTAEAFLRHIQASDDKRRAWEDILWTVLNSQEFIYQH